MRSFFRFLSVILMLLCVSRLHAQKTWATRVLAFSREFDTPPYCWSSVDILGEPDVYPAYGNVCGAWTHPDNSQREWIELEFNNAGPIDSIFIYETNRPGHVDSVYVKDPGTGTWTLVWSDTATAGPAAANILAVGFTMTAFNVSEVRIAIANDMASNEVAYDAVAISPATPAEEQYSNHAGTNLRFHGNGKLDTRMRSAQLISDTSFTISCWVRPSAVGPVGGDVFELAGIACDEGGYAGISHGSIGTGDSLWMFVWDNPNPYQIGVSVPLNVWTHVAMTYHNGEMKAYRNGFHVRTVSGVVAPTVYDLAFYVGWNDLTSEGFNGNIEEVKFFQRALSLYEVRETMHRNCSGADSAFTAYYQLNEGAGTQPHNAVNWIQAELDTNTTWATSSAPVGGGTANSQTETAGAVNFTATACSIFYTTPDSAEVTVTRMLTAPFAPPAAPTVFTQQYWSLNRYKGGVYTGDITVTLLDDLSLTVDSLPQNFLLYSRSSIDTAAWAFVDSADVYDPASKTITFNNVSLRGQFVIGYSEIILSQNEEKSAATLEVFPNPCDGKFFVRVNGNHSGEQSLTLTNMQGQVVFTQPLGVSGQVILQEIQTVLAPGVYVAEVHSPIYIMRKKVVIQR